MPTEADVEVKLALFREFAESGERPAASTSRRNGVVHRVVPRPIEASAPSVSSISARRRHHSHGPALLRRADATPGRGGQCQLLRQLRLGLARRAAALHRLGRVGPAANDGRAPDLAVGEVAPSLRPGSTTARSRGAWWTTSSSPERTCSSSGRKKWPEPGATRGERPSDPSSRWTSCGRSREPGTRRDSRGFARRPKPEEMRSIFASIGLEDDFWDPKSDRFGA
jgi:hypothetical protein